MKLYQFPWGIYPRRILIYLQEKDITDIELVDVDIVGGESRTPEFLARNPTGTIPVLETDDGQFIRQSTSILTYLESRYPAPDMNGTTAEQRARTLDQLMLVNEAYNFAGICTYYGSPLFVQRREPSDETARAMHFEYARTLIALESLAGDDDYLGGNVPNIADVCFFASEQFMRTLYQIQMPEECTRLHAIYDRFLARPSAAAPSYPDFVVQHAPIRNFIY